MNLVIALQHVRFRPNTKTWTMQGKLAAEQRSELIEQGKALKEKLAGLEDRLAVLQDALQFEGQKLPNQTHPEV